MRVLLAIGLTLLLSSTTAAQFGGKGGGKFGNRDGGGGSMMMMGDPGKMFDFISRGKPYILIAESRKRAELEEFAKAKGITNGQITREQYIAFSEQMKTKMTSGAAPGGGDGKGSNLSPGGDTKPIDSAEWVDREFKRRDDNGDGFLNTDEMSFLLRSDYKKWDANQDDLIDASEFRAYTQALTQRPNTPAANEGTIVKILPSEEDLDRRPVVFRAGKLPRELPGWFAECDADTDGQVALHEWHNKEKALDDFRQMDRNDDGFLTAEEVLRHENLKANGKIKSESGTTVASSGRPSSPGMSRGNGSGRGGSGQGNFDMKSFFEKFKKK